MAYAERTLVKSPPELWELVDDHELMGRWAAELLGTQQPISVEVTARENGERLAWRPAGPRYGASMELTLAEKGWGTNVSIEARCERPAGATLEAVLERLLDELGSPQRRPFARN
jgi:hypothetical protein